MRGLLALIAIATMATGCREAMEGRFIYYPSRTMSGDPSRVGLAFRDVAFTAGDGVKLHGWLILPGGRHYDMDATWADYWTAWRTFLERVAAATSMHAER